MTPVTLSKKLVDAMGRGSCDWISVANAWAAIQINRVRVGEYVVLGNCDRRTFGTVTEALEYALTELSKFEKGRAD